MFVAGQGIKRSLSRKKFTPGLPSAFAFFMTAGLSLGAYIQFSTDWKAYDKRYQDEAYKNAMEQRGWIDKYRTQRFWNDPLNEATIPSKCSYSISTGTRCEAEPLHTPKPYPLPIMPPPTTASGAQMDWHKDHGQ